MKGVASVLLALAVAAADRPSLEYVLARVTEYVVRYQRELSGIVAEEHYVQDADKSDRPLVTHRELKSDLLLVRAEDRTDAYVQFRDVFEVDGSAVRDRSDRLVKLFMHPSESARRQAADIMNESARYNIGKVQRNINVPLLALLMFDPMYQRHFKYSFGIEHRGTPRGLPKSAAFSLAADAWEIDYDEIETPTIIKGDDADARSHGRIWAEPETGRVLMTELVNDARTVRSTIQVSFQADPVGSMLPPAEMRETYVMKRRPYTVEGTATYSNFRRFTVNTTEEIATPRE